MKYAQPQDLPAITREHPGPGRHSRKTTPGTQGLLGITSGHRPPPQPPAPAHRLEKAHLRGFGDFRESCLPQNANNFLPGGLYRHRLHSPDSPHYRATGSQPRRWRTDWRYSHSMASLSRWASRPPLVTPAMSATPRRVPTETTNPLPWKVNASSGLPRSSASRLRATVSPSSSATCASGGSTCPVLGSTTEARSPAATSPRWWTRAR